MNPKARQLFQEMFEVIEVFQHHAETRVPIRGSNPYKASRPVKRAVRGRLVWRADVEAAAWDGINGNRSLMGRFARGTVFGRFV